MRVPLPPRSSHPLQGLGRTSAQYLQPRRPGEEGRQGVQVLQAGNGRTDAPPPHRPRASASVRCKAMSPRPRPMVAGGCPLTLQSLCALQHLGPAMVQSTGIPPFTRAKHTGCELAASKSLTEQNYGRASVSVPEAG